MNTLERLLHAWKTKKQLPPDLTKGQLEEIRDALPKEATNEALLTAIDSAIADRPNRAA